MKVIVAGDEIELGTTEAKPTIGIVDYSRRETDDFGVTTVVRRGFARRMSVRAKVPFSDVDALQSTLADLRAQPVKWVADERFASLAFDGFYKDFAIDLAVPPVSFCTLTVEGLTETEAGADPGGDPAADGNSSTLRLLQPATIDDSVLTAINVPEDDQPVWSAGTTYPFGARVIRAHRQWESLVVANLGNEPAAGSAQWMDIGPTNRWAMFDDALGTLTEAAASIIATLDPAGPIDALALLDVTAATVRVQAVGYDRTIAPSAAGSAMFLDIPAIASAITVTVTGAGTVSVGTMMIGNLVGLGVTEASPSAGINDYSRKETDDFGDVTVVERAWAKRMDARALLRTDAVDLVFDRIATVRGRPCLWIGAEGVEALSIYGFFKDFSIEVDENVSTLSLSIEGLSKAAQLAPLDSPPYLVTVFQNAAEAPAPPPIDAGEVPPGWTLAPLDLATGQYRWSTQAKFLLGVQQTAWTQPVKVGGVSWQDVVDADPEHPKPEDGATVGATPEQAEAITQHTEQINQALEDIQGLIDTYGTTSSAAASAALAEAAKNAAESAKTSSIDARDDASGFATAAAGSATVAHDAEVAAAASEGLAATYKGQALASAELAEDSAVVASDRASAASSSATLAATYATGSRLAAAQQVPSDFQQDGTFFFAGFEGLPETRTPLTADAIFSFVVSNDRGKVLRVNSASAINVSTIGMYRMIAGHRYRITVEARRVSGSARNVLGYLIGINGTGTSAGNNANPVSLATVNQWYTVSREVDANTMIAAGGASIRGLCQVAAGTGVVDIASILLEDITDATTLQAQISTNADAIAAANVAAATLTTEVRTGANPNLLPNGSAEAKLKYWSGHADYSFVVNSNGPYFFLGGSLTGTHVFNADNVALEPGTYTLSYEMNNSGAGVQAYCDVLCFDSGGAQIYDGPQTISTGFTSFSNRITTTFTAPAGTANMRVRIVSVKTAAADRVRVRRIKLEQGAVATAWTTDASVKETFSSLTTLDGKTAAYWQVNSAVPGSRAQLTVWADNAGAGVDIVGNVAISGALLVNGTINGVKLADLAVATAKLANNAATVPVTAYTEAEITEAENVWLEVQSVTVTTTGALVDIITSGTLKFPSVSTAIGYARTQMRIKRNGTVIREQPEMLGVRITDITTYGSGTIAMSDNPIAGTYTYTVEVLAKNMSLAVRQRYLRVVEMKK